MKKTTTKIHPIKKQQHINRLLLISCMLGFLSIVTSAIIFIAIPLAIIGFIFSFLSMKEEQHHRINFATILNLIAIFLSIISWIALLN